MPVRLPLSHTHIHTHSLLIYFYLYFDRIPEIAARVFGQGVLPLLERSIHQSNCLADVEVIFFIPPSITTL